MEEHTKLINMILGFTKSDENWPNLFSKFDVCSIDRCFNNNNFKSVCPDVILASKYYNSIILFECKSKKTFTSEDQMQLEKYLSVNYNNVKHFVNIVHPSVVNIDLSYVLSNNSQLIEYFDNKNIPIFIDSNKINCKYIDSYKCQQFKTDLIKKIRDLSENIYVFPKYIRYLPGDNKIFLIRLVISRLMSLYSKNFKSNVKKINEIFDPNLICQEIFGEYIKILDHKKKKRVVDDIKSHLNYLESGGLKDSFINKNSFKKINVICENLVASYELNYKGQKNIFDFD